VAAVAVGRLFETLIEELMPTPQQHLAAPDNDAPDPLSFAASVPPDFVLPDRLEPELRAAVARSNMDVGRLVRPPILVGVEEEAVRAEAMDRGHADLELSRSGVVDSMAGQRDF
jgi:hypothetical protein